MQPPSFSHVLTGRADARLIVVAVLFAASGAWQILTTMDPSKIAVQVVIAAGVAALAAVLLFARELRQIVRPPLYVALVLGLIIWLVLSFGVSQWQWGLSPQ
jgi:hypothetical protein